jgi:hypothetical protein
MNNRGIVSFIIILILISSGCSNIAGSSPASVKNQNQPYYGFIIKVTGNQSHGTQTNITRVINKLLSFDASVYWLTSDILVLAQGLKNDSTTNEHLFNKGSFLIPIGNNSL